MTMWAEPGLKQAPFYINFHKNGKNAIEFNCHNMTFKEYIFEPQNKKRPVISSVFAGRSKI